MLHRILQPTAPAHEKIRWRGEQPSRIESFSDAVFGFAVTLLVFSLEVPRSFDQLLHLIRGIPAFVCSFTILTSMWWSHCMFFRRYGLHDRLTARLNTVLLMVVVVYLYPLKFLFDLAFGMAFDRERAMGMITSLTQVRQLETFYGIGFGIYYIAIGLMTLHALRQREALALTPEEVRETWLGVMRCVAGLAANALLVIFAWVLPGFLVFWSQLALFAIGPLLSLLRRAYPQQLEQASPP